MTDAFVYRPEGSPDIIERQRLNQAGGGGASGGGSGSSGGSGGGGQSLGSNESRENPAYTGRGDSRNNNAQERTGQGDPGIPQSQGAQPFQRQHLFGQPSNHTSQGEQPKESQPMYCPPSFGAVAPYAFNPYASPYGYGAFPAAAAPAGANVVVAGDHGHGTHSQLETLSDIALGGLRESAATGRTNQLSTQIAQLGERHSLEAGFSRELNTQREFTAAQKDRGDLENRLLAAIKDESIRTREMFTDSRIRELETRNADLRDARRDDRILEVLQDIRRNQRPA